MNIFTGNSRLFALLFAAFCIITSAYSQTNVPTGNVSGTWTLTNSPYNINGDITIQSGTTLSIQPGVVVMFQGHYKLDVQGRLLAIGTATNMIMFSAANTTTGWKGIRFNNTPSSNDSSKIVYSKISYGKATIGSAEDRMGGGIFSKSVSKLYICNNIITNNLAGFYGGGICCGYAANPLIINNVISNNTAHSGGGGIYCYISSNPYIVNNTIVNNNASYYGGIYANGTDPVIKNCIIWGNSPTGDQIYPSYLTNVSYCNAQGSYTGTGNINSNPSFIAPSTGAGYTYSGLTSNWGLQTSSPCINIASMSLTGLNIPEYDIVGNLRIDFDTIDMGAYEYMMSIYSCGNITSNTTWSGYVKINCDVTVNNGITLTVLPGTHIECLGHYRLNVKGRLLAVGAVNSMITFTARNTSAGWQGIRFDSTSTSNDTSKIEYCSIKYGNANGSGTDSYGGGIYIRNVSKILIRNNFITNNISTNHGGAIYCEKGSPLIISNVITNNQANSTYGGGIYIVDTLSAPKIINNTIANNSSTNSGGGIYSLSNIPVIKNNIIWGNTASDTGIAKQIYPVLLTDVDYNDISGGLVYPGTGNINSNPQFKNSSGGAGASYDGLSANWTIQASSPCVNFGTPSTTNLNLPLLDIKGRTRIFGTVDIGAYENVSLFGFCGNITSNTTWNADTVQVNCNVTINNGAKLTIAPGTKVIFQGHYKIEVLGSLWAIGTSTDSITFTAANTTVGWSGIRINNPNTQNDSTKIQYCNIEYGKPTGAVYESSGGGIYVYNYDKIVISNCYLHNNVTPLTSYGNGGAIYVDNANIIIRDNIIKNNISRNGSGIYTYHFDGKIINNIIANNSANNDGGGLYVYSSDAKISNNTISNNTSANSGGGVYIYTFNTSELINNNIVNNTADYGGGVNCSYDCPPRFINNTIANNKANIFGGGFYLSNNADPIIKNTIIYGNVANGISNQFYLQDIGSDPKIYYSDIQGGRAGFTGIGSGLNYTGVFQQNINKIPSFTTPTTGAGNAYNGLSADWYILAGSYCINTGTPIISGLNLPVVDILGSKRVYNGRIDMGATENHDDISVCGTISENTEWDADTIKVTCDITVNDSVSLTITEGTFVQFEGPFKINVQGRILAMGSSKRMITFSINDTSNFSNMSSTNGGWKGIQFISTPSNNDSSKFLFCKFHYGKKPAIGSAAGQVGGALFIYNTNKVLISNCLFSNNRAGYKAGAIYIESSNPVLHNNTITNNTAFGYCPVVCFSYGGGIYIDDGDPSLVNNTIVNNLAHQGGGIFCWSASPVIKNMILWGNIASVYPSGYPNGLHQMQLMQGSAPKIYNSNIQGGRSGIANNNLINTYQDNIDTIPEFNSPSMGVGADYNGTISDWSVQATSPCVNSGVKQVQGLYSEDLAGNVRTVGDTLDMGAYETQISRRFITSHPTPQSVCLGTVATFSVSASIVASYQWQKDRINIPGATNATLIINPVSLADSGAYSCVLSNLYGSIRSDTVLLVVKTPPSIVSQPVPNFSCLYQSASFSVSVTGTDPISYQWYNTNGILTGATNDTFRIFSVTNNDVSNYHCIVSNSCGLATSNGASLSIKSPPITTSIPVSTTLCESNSLTFNTTATGTQPISYQWYFNSNALSGDTNTSYVISSATTSNAGFYYCKATNICGFDSTNTSTLTVNEAPNITSQSSNTTICEGQSVTLSITASGTAPITYQWFYNNNSISGATNNTYTINSVSTSNAGSFHCIATNSCGIAQSNSISLTVNLAPSISSQTTNPTRCVGQSMTFSITASGTAISYQWYNVNGSISGATNNTYTINSVDTQHIGFYYCIVSNTCASVQTANIYLTVNQAPGITSQSPNTTICEGQGNTFSISTSGTSPISYQWYYNNNAISGAILNSITMNSVGTSDAGTYYCVATNSCGNIQTSNINLTVNQSPGITSQSTNATQCIGQSMTFSITATGSSPITYQWYYDTGAIANATNNIYTINSVSSGNAGNYYCVASNSCGSFQSTTKTLTVNSSPSILSQTPSSSICTGQSMTFTISASGTNPITYQWYKSSGAITAATSNSYTINSVDTSDAGSYYCIATNLCGTAQGNNIILTVNQPPSISSQSSNSSICVGQGMTFSVTTSGTAPITYQWYHDTITIANATNNMYTINAVNTNDAGNYYCIATNSCGFVQSTAKTLAVNTSPTISSQTTNSTRCIGQSMNFNTTVSGTAPISYQWYDNNGAISGAINNLYILNSLTTSHAGNYYCIASNVCGSDQTTNITLTVNEPPSIISQSSNSSVCVGQSMTFSVTATGTSPINYQWLHDTGIIAGANNNIYTNNSVDTLDDGNYYCIVTNSCGVAQSTGIMLTTNTIPGITTHSDSAILCTGQNTVFNITATSNTPISYQWYYDNVAITGAVNNFYFLSSITPSHAGNYHCISTNKCGNSQSDNINLQVKNPVTFITQSGDSSKCEGTNATFNVNVTGTSPISYKWYNDTINISGANNNSHLISSISIADAGIYYCEVTNYCGTYNSTYKTLTVNPIPIVDIGNDTTFCESGVDTLSPGSGYFCLWNTGSINPELIVNETGNYFVHVTDGNGCQNISDTVHVEVLHPYPHEKICVVSTFPPSGKNIIAWERTSGQGIIGYNVYKESIIGGVFQLIGTRPFDSLSVFEDVNSDPRKRSYRYQITSLDTCGNESPPSAYHETLHLTANKGTSGENNLNWNHYVGYPFDYYRIYRGTAGSNLTAIDSVPSTTNSFSDLNPPNGLVFYQVSAVKNDICYPAVIRGITKSGPYSQSLSNLKDYSNAPGNYLTIEPATLVLDSNAGSFGKSNIYTNTKYWSASTSEDWLELTSDTLNGTLRITALTENTGSESRSGLIVVSTDDVTDQTILVHQKGKWNNIGIEESYLYNSLKIFPNPFNETTRIVLPETEKSIKKLEVYDFRGKLIKSSYNIKGNYYELSSEGIAKGMYLLRIMANSVYMDKIIVE